MIISRDWWVNRLINDRKIQRALWVETSPLRDDAERRREMVQWVRAGFSLQDEANQKKIGLLQPAHVLWTLQPTRRRRQRGRREDGDGSLRSGSYLLTLTSLWSCEALGAVPLSHSCSAVPLSFYIFTKKKQQPCLLTVLYLLGAHHHLKPCRTLRTWRSSPASWSGSSGVRWVSCGWFTVLLTAALCLSVCAGSACTAVRRLPTTGCDIFCPILVYCIRVKPVPIHLTCHAIVALQHNEV